MKLGDKIAEDIDVIPTGSIGLDLAQELAVIQGEELLKYMGQNHPVKLH